jgi:hypothetical protein
MTTIHEIPLTPRAQVMRCDMGGVTYTFHFKYNKAMQCWIMDIRDGNDFPIGGTGGLDGIPLVTGTDLLGQFRYLGIGGGIPMIVMTVAVGHSPDEVPTFTNLGVDGHLYFETLV